MDIARFSIGRPVTVLVFIILILIIGTFAITNIPIEMMPEFNPPVLIVSTTYSGAQPDQVEDRITRPLESMLMNVSGLKELTSTSAKNSSIITLNFDWGEDLGEAANDTRDKIEMIKRMLPTEAETPMIFKFDTSMMPIMYIRVSGNMDQDDLYDITYDNIKPLFEQINGVAMASLRGGQEQIVEVSASQNRLDALGITLSTVASIIGSQNVDAGGGDIKEGDTVYSIKTTGEFTSLEQISEMVIMTTPSGRQVKIKDIGEVRWSHKDLTNKVYVNHQEGLMLAIQRQSGVNSIEVADRVLATLKQVDAMFPGVHLEVLYNSTQIIKDTINQVISSLIEGAIFAMLVIFLFMRDVRSALIIGISIPLSVLITLIAMYFCDFTLNMFTLTGLILGLGMVVDASIVVLENIFRYREKGTKLEPAAILGAGEMSGAIMGSTLTTVCVFVPMVLFAGKLDMMGLVMKPLAFTIIFSLLSSLAVAVTVVPLMSAKWPRVYTTAQREIKFKPLALFDKFMEKILHAIERAYRWLLSVFVAKGKKSGVASFIFSVVLFFTIILTGGMLFSKGINLSPEGEADSVTLNIKLVEGTRLEVTSALVLELQNRIEEYLIEKDENGNVVKRHFDNIIASCGATGMLNNGASEHTGALNIYLPLYAERTIGENEIKGWLRSFFPDYPGVQFYFGSSGMQMGSGYPFDIKIIGHDLDKIMKTAVSVKQLVEQKCDYVLEPNVDFDDGLPQLLVNIDRQKAYEKGLNMYNIGREILANIDGIRASVFRIDGDEYELHVRLLEDDRSQVIDLDRVSLTSSLGKRIPLSSIANVEVISGPVKINRENQQRVAHVQGRLTPNVSSSLATSKVINLVNEQLVLDSGVIIVPGGDVEDMKKMFFYVIIIIVFAILLVFGVMASIFENMLDPFIIFLTLFTLPIGIGVIYMLTSTQLSMFSVIGMILLVGIVVNNGIVLVDYINLLRGRGYEIHDALLTAGVSRLRPVLMTSLTTILGMVPMAFFPGEGSDVVQPIGVTIVGGMSVSTILTLFIVPIAYLAFEKMKNFLGNIFSSLRRLFHNLLVKLKLVKEGSYVDLSKEGLDFSDVVASSLYQNDSLDIDISSYKPRRKSPRPKGDK